mmetsp:Transcript_29820/g.22109  ORF Transcript_29820/g.22109 Transcript_29820/m.22109 type:complete len:127 (-) Transcript_29820:30-410(-)
MHLYSTMLVGSALVNNIVLTETFSLELMDYKTFTFRLSFFIYALAVNGLYYAVKEKMKKGIIKEGCADEHGTIERTAKVSTFLLGFGIVVSPVISGVVFDKEQLGGVAMLLAGIVVTNSIFLAMQK